MPSALTNSALTNSEGEEQTTRAPRPGDTGSQVPLAARMRPQGFEEFVGQEEIIGPGRVLSRAIEAHRLPSIILWGPPGTGKTTLAMLIGEVSGVHVESISAVTSGVADLRKIVERAKQRGETILFVDEIHRFNKSQQDVVLPHVENGTFTLIGATTENPSFEVIAPLLSRCRVFNLKPLSDEDVRRIVDRALTDTERGLGELGAVLDDKVVDHLVNTANGDARIALNGLETACYATPPDDNGARRVDMATMIEALQRRNVLYDRAGDQHYDHISAFIKSVRGSDPDAAMYWLARMIEAGEDPMFIARRIVILAAEDIGLADPAALSLAVATQQAVHFIGFPEGAIPLAEATIYLASAPKSNSANAALNRAREDVQNTRNEPVPLHLRNAVTGLMRGAGYGRGYQYAHDHPDHFVVQDFRPPSVQDHRYYEPTEQGLEKEAAERLRQWWSQHQDGPG